MKRTGQDIDFEVQNGFYTLLVRQNRKDDRSYDTDKNFEVNKNGVGGDNKLKRG